MANKTTIRRLSEAFLCVAIVAILVVVKCVASNVSFSDELSADREQGGHNLAAAADIATGLAIEPPDTPADDEYQPEKDLQEQEKNRQKQRGNNGPNNNGSKPKDGKSKDKNKQPEADPADDGTGQWVLVLGTFTEADHENAAKNMIQGLRKIAPEVTGLRVHTNTKGSLVVHGDYTGREDPKADKDQAWLKGIKYQNRNVFNRVMLTHIDLRGEGQLHPHDLLSARRAHPKVNPLYTLDVALWDDFDAGKMKVEEIRKKAEAYASQLRKQGHEAYFYHDEVNKRSIVTVGLFDRNAINPKSGLFSIDVELTMKKFPVRLVNGEELREFKDKYNPKLGTIPQTPKLVEVPTL